MRMVRGCIRAWEAWDFPEIGGSHFEGLLQKDQRIALGSLMFWRTFHALELLCVLEMRVLSRKDFRSAMVDLGFGQASAL